MHDKINIHYWLELLIFYHQEGLGKVSVDLRNLFEEVITEREATWIYEATSSDIHNLIRYDGITPIWTYSTIELIDWIIENEITSELISKGFYDHFQKQFSFIELVNIINNPDFQAKIKQYNVLTKSEEQELKNLLES